MFFDYLKYVFLDFEGFFFVSMGNKSLFCLVFMFDFFEFIF